MTKGIKVTVLALAFLTVIGGFIYFVSGFTSVYPPIATYSYSGHVDSLISGIQAYSKKNPTVSFKDPDTVGSSRVPFPFYSDLGIHNPDRSVVYNLKFDPIDGSDRTKGTFVYIIGAHDYQHKIGGYTINDTGVRDMLKHFESGFLIELKKKGKIDIVRSSK